MAPNKLALSVLLLLFAAGMLQLQGAASHLNHRRAPQKMTGCRTVIIRVPTPNNKFYVLTCRCGKMQRYRGRSIERIPPFVRDTRAQARVTVHCMQRELKRLTHRCSESARAFETAATHVMRRCIRRVRPVRDNGAPFRYNRKRCRAEFRSIDGRIVQDGRNRLETLLVCACPQGAGYSVNPGVAQLLVAGNRRVAEREAASVFKCTKKTVEKFGGACGGPVTARFDLRAAQALNVCCKRARAKMPNSKLRCQRLVPDDISTIQIHG